MNTDSDLSPVIRLAESIEYQEGGVVSREIISRKTGTLTIFAFDRGQGLSEHTAPFDATVLCVEGELEITISGRPHRLTHGDLLIMPANQPHSLHALKPVKMLLIMIRA